MQLETMDGGRVCGQGWQRDGVAVEGGVSCRLPVREGVCCGGSRGV